MIAVNDIILKLRSRLGDTDPAKEKWSDTELIDNINSALVQLSVSMLYSFKTQKYLIQEGKNRYELPQNMVRAVAVTIDDERVKIKSFESIQNNKADVESQSFTICMDEISFFLYPLALFKDDMVLVFDYNYIQQINGIEETIDMPVMLSDAILFYAMHMSLQVNTSEKNVNKSAHYLNLYDRQVEMMSNTIYRNKHSKRLTSRYKRF